MVQWHPDLLNRHIAPGIASFTACDIPDLVPNFSNAPNWMPKLFFVSALQAEYKGNGRQFASNIVFRAHAAFDFYHEARLKTMEFIEKSGPDSPRMLLYYAAVRLWESCLLNLQVLTDVITKLVSGKLYEQDDGSSEQRAYDLANTIKHWGSAIRRSEYEDGDTLPIWLSQDGIVSRKYTLTYQELAELIREAALSAEEMCDPSARSRPANSTNEDSVN